VITASDNEHLNPTHAATPTAQRLFDTAALLFFEKGFAATTTREIASAVGIQQASLYYHVSGKEDLLHRICVSSLEQLLAEVQSAVLESANPLERIRILARTHVRAILKHQIRYVTILNEMRALSDPHRAEVVALRRKCATLVRALIEEAQAAGSIRTDIPSRYLYLALLNVLNWAVLWYRKGQTLSEEGAYVHFDLSRRSIQWTESRAIRDAWSACRPKEERGQRAVGRPNHA
jgi:TetR/AcrR family transcriptional regulator, cholesterol catabolism regulator